MADYERLREQAVAAQPGGWRLGWGVLACRGMAAWITAWTALAPAADRHGMAAASSQALSLSTTTPSLSRPSPEGGEDRKACSSVLPAATAEIVAVLAAMTLAHAR